MSNPTPRDSEDRSATTGMSTPVTQWEAEGRFAGVIAHDLNNLLQGVVGSIELVRNFIRMGKVDQVDRFLEAATNSARRIAMVTDRLHAFSGRAPAALASVDVNAVVSATASKAMDGAGPSIQLESMLSESLWSIPGDAAMLEKAITELIFNSRDALPDGGTISVSTRNVTMDDPAAATGEAGVAGDFVCIRVADNGAGMTAEVGERAFEPLFTTRAAGLAKGLGLPIVQILMAQMHGFVRISSKVGRGTTADLYLPRNRESTRP